MPGEDPPTFPIEVSSDQNSTAESIFVEEKFEHQGENQDRSLVGERPPPKVSSSQTARDNKIHRSRSSSVENIAEISGEIVELLEDGYHDAQIPWKLDKGGLNVDWERVVSLLNVFEDFYGKKKVLETKFGREVTVYEDGRAPWNNDEETAIHRQYMDPEDTVLNQILRRHPPSFVKELLEEISLSYRWSRALFDILEKLERDDDEWQTVDELLKEIQIMEDKRMRDIVVDISDQIQRNHEQTNWEAIEQQMTELEGKRSVAEEKKVLESIIELVEEGNVDWDAVERRLGKIKKTHAIEKAKHGSGGSSRLVLQHVGNSELSLAELREVFYIKHSWREETLLMISSRRKPPVPIVERMLKLGPKAISMVDCSLYDWIPLRYSLNYAALPAVTELLIPKEDDAAYFVNHLDHQERLKFGVQGTLEEMQKRRAKFFAFGVDVYGSNALHWTVVYDAPLETVKALVHYAGDFAAELREMGDRQGNYPYELAIRDGEGIDFIELLTPNSMDIETIEYDLVSSIATTNQKYKPSEEIYSTLAVAIAEKYPLQNLLIRRSCEAIPAMILMLDFYAAIFLIVSFRQSVEYYTSDGRDSDSSTPGWWYPLIIAVSFMLGRELFQVLGRPEFYFLVMWNYVELAIVGVVGAAAIIMQIEDIRDYNSLIVAASFFTWFNFIIFLRNTMLSFSIFVSGMQKIVAGLIPFVVISGLILMGFAEMFWAQSWLTGACGQNGSNDDEDQKFCNYWDSLLTMYAFFVGGIDVRDESVENANKWGDFTIIACLFGFIVAIVLLNVVIAIVSDLWDGVSSAGEKVYWENRLAFFHDLLVYERSLVKEDKDGVPRRTFLGYFLFMIEELVRTADNLLERFILKPLWVRADLWGYFDNIVDRMFSKEYGGFRWQLNYDWNVAKSANNGRKMTILVVKTVSLVVAFSIILAVWFLLGLVSAGLLWSKAIRRLFLGRHTEISDD